MGTAERTRIADALYLLAAGADAALLLSTMRRFVIVHSTSNDDVLAMLRELQEANPEGFADGIVKVFKTEGRTIATAAEVRRAKNLARQRKRLARKQRT